MKIAIVSKRAFVYRGGVERQSYNLASCLQKRFGVKVEVIDFEPGPKIYNKFLDIEEKTVPCRFMLLNICFDLIKIWRALRVESEVMLINIPNPTVEIVIAFLLRLRMIRTKKLVFYFHCRAQRYGFYKILRIVEYFNFKKSAHIFVTTPKFLNYPEISRFRDKVSVLPNWVSSDFIEPHAPYTKLKDVLSSGNMYRVLFVGRFVWYKGIPLLLKVVADLPWLHLRLVGHGPLYRRIRRFIKKYGLEKRVEIFMSITDRELKKLYHWAELFVLPSVSPAEGFGISLLEAMANQVPVIAARVESGVTELVRHKETGLLFEPGSYSSLKKTLIFAHQNKEFMKKLAKNAYNVIINNYTEDRCGDKVWKELINT